MSGADRLPADEFRAVEAELNTRWPETKIDPTLDRIKALLDLLGDAAHPMPPGGLGANLAFRDVRLLAETIKTTLASGGALLTALSDCEREMCDYAGQAREEALATIPLPTRS